MWAKKNECGQENLSVLSVSVSVDCGVWTVDYDSAVSGEPPSRDNTNDGKGVCDSFFIYVMLLI